MNTSKIKSYAIQARRDFIRAVTERANWYGIFSDDNIEPMKFKGDAAIIGERPFPKREGELREKLVNRVKRDGFETTMRAGAYTWFNRFVALRYMEIHDYLDHRYRVLSNVGGSTAPEILENAAEVDFKGLDKEKVIELKLAGTRDNELFRMLLLAQCDALHKSMPFLFDRIDSETELLLPDNLLHSDSPVRKLVNEIDESDWRDVEIIGWIYQFYISERKDQVIGKVVKSEDIPAATQLFTPNWIVKYMVQNTLGRMWLATYPDSPLREKMEYYIEPAEQKPVVQKQIDEITPKELNPEEITFLDPACGSGHILVEAYDIFKEIYLERGYRTRDIPKLILEKNLFGLDICDRAGQLACFSVLMKAREDDRKILERNIELNVMSIQESDASDTKNIEIFFKDDEELKNGLQDIIELFENAKTFGSLISVPENLTEKMELFDSDIPKKIDVMFKRKILGRFQGLLKQADILGKKYDCVVTNPPYMGNNGLNPKLKNLAKTRFSDSKSDLFAIFIERIFSLVSQSRYVGIMTPFTWMFLSSYEKLREKILKKRILTSLVRPEYHAFFDSAYVPLCSFTMLSISISAYKGIYIDLNQFYGSEKQATKTLEAIKDPSCDWRHKASADDFKKIPGNPIAYWISRKDIFLFANFKKISDSFPVKSGIMTGNDDLFLKFWHEIDSSLIGFNLENSSQMHSKWFPLSKGGAFRKWFGNAEHVINLGNDAHDIRNGGVNYRLRDNKWYFQPYITWSRISSFKVAFRYFKNGILFSDAGPGIFAGRKCLEVISLLNSKLGNHFLSIINPTLNYQTRDIESIPTIATDTAQIVERLIKIAKLDWDSFEISWSFFSIQLLKPALQKQTLERSYASIRVYWRNAIQETQNLEEENNRIFIEAYGLQDELTPEVPLSEITLTCNPHYRFSGKKSEEELEALLLTDTMKEMISYAIGCMMGRYSLDEPGLVYAHSQNIGFDPSKYKTFPADDDGIIPIMDQDWFPDDATNRFVEFLKVAWSPETLDENLKFVAERLDPKKNEEPVETIRRYLSTNFFKDHMKMYKKRPIYWLFSSGKAKAFECLVYLHRYNESTLSRIRGNYVIPLQGNISARLEFLQSEKDTASTASAQKKFQKEIDLLKKKQAELSKFDDELRHCADMKISLDLDDGVKVNYGKFGNLLAEKNAVAG